LCPISRGEVIAKDNFLTSIRKVPGGRRKLHIGEIHNLNSACVNIRMIRTMRTVRTVHLTKSQIDKSTLEEKRVFWIIGEWLEVRLDWITID